jgi:hypothetical protein
MRQTIVVNDKGIIESVFVKITNLEYLITSIEKIVDLQMQPILRIGHKYKEKDNIPGVEVEVIRIVSNIQESEAVKEDVTVVSPSTSVEEADGVSENILESEHTTEVAVPEITVTENIQESEAAKEDVTVASSASKSEDVAVTENVQESKPTKEPAKEVVEQEIAVTEAVPEPEAVAEKDREDDYTSGSKEVVASENNNDGVQNGEEDRVENVVKQQGVTWQAAKSFIPDPFGVRGYPTI